MNKLSKHSMRKQPFQQKQHLEWITKRSEQPPGGCGRRVGTEVYAWHMPIPSTGRARLMVSAVVLSATLRVANKTQEEAVSR
ncbi:hypothetical protein PD5205_03108 [Xanthomonas fragariae]|uniref:Uncharacterized protein n=1 Tax=Xanthomonas fragariae TaxID=48664 RepID=A0A1Y6HQ37_9XANT|nr:hypothetical protein PD885_00887 [Xanthomonas fragariae]SMR04390.1 hypothetical protein PD5205_03108 [Xanthomonas fragariae]